MLRWRVAHRIVDLPLDLMPDPGASAECARVPPPTAATTDALRTPRVGVAGRREKLKIRARASVYEVLSVLLLASENSVEQKRTRAERARHLWLRRTTGRQRNRLLQVAGHQRCPTDGGPRFMLHLQPAHCRRASPRHHGRGPGPGDDAAHGGDGGPPERRRQELSRQGPRFRRMHGDPGRLQPGLSRSLRSRTATPSRCCTRGAGKPRRGQSHEGRARAAVTVLDYDHARDWEAVKRIHQEVGWLDDQNDAIRLEQLARLLDGRSVPLGRQSRMRGFHRARCHAPPGDRRRHDRRRWADDEPRRPQAWCRERADGPRARQRG